MATRASFEGFSRLRLVWPLHSPASCWAQSPYQWRQVSVARLCELQASLYARDRWALLLIFQAMDAAGNGETIKRGAVCSRRRSAGQELGLGRWRPDAKSLEAVAETARGRPSGPCR